MKKSIEKLFPAALTAIQQLLDEDYGEYGIPAEYQAYISSFGASIMQMGLMPTLAVYADEDSGAARDKRLMLRILSQVLTDKASTLAAEIKTKINDNDNLFHAAIDLEADESAELRDHLLDAAVATKLCIRTFKTDRR